MQLLKIPHPVLSVRSNKTTYGHIWNCISDFSDMLYASNTEFPTSLIFILAILFIHCMYLHKDFQSGVKLKEKIVSHFQIAGDISFKDEASK